jgi:hypothetical protein
VAEQATRVLTRPPKAVLKIERRAWLRFPGEQDIACEPVASRPDGEPQIAWLGNVRDVSPAGIGLSMTRRFEPGVELIVELSVKGKETLHLPVRVVHVTPDTKRRWIIGCEFIFELTEDERRTLGFSPSETAHDNPPGPPQRAPADR